MNTTFYIDNIKYQFNCKIKTSTNLKRSNIIYSNNIMNINSYADTTVELISSDIFLYQVMDKQIKKMKKFELKLISYTNLYCYGTFISELEQYDIFSNNSFKVVLSCDYIEYNKLSLKKERKIKLESIL